MDVESLEEQEIIGWKEVPLLERQESILDLPTPTLGTPRPFGFEGKLSWDTKRSLSRSPTSCPWEPRKRGKRDFDADVIRDVERSCANRDFTKAVRCVRHSDWSSIARLPVKKSDFLNKPFEAADSFSRRPGRRDAKH